MKIRQGFVSNSSSSSFVIISVCKEEGSHVLYEDGDTEMEHCGGISIPIDEMIEKLQKAKEKGYTKIEIDHGGGYEG